MSSADDSIRVSRVTERNLHRNPGNIPNEMFWAMEMWTSSRATLGNRRSSGVDNAVTIFQSQDTHSVTHTTHLSPTVPQPWCYGI